MKLSEIVQSNKSQKCRDVVSYSWHLSGGKKNNRAEKYAFCVAIPEHVLKSARFREGDNADIAFYMDSMEILLAPTMPFTLYRRNKSDSKRQIKVSSKGINSVMSMCPKIGTPVELEVISTDVGKITLRLPSVSV
jgi:hypothetical protein